MRTNTSTGPTTDVGDFDFLVGRWNVRHTRLLRPLSQDSEWEEFEGTAVCHAPLFDGAANLDELTCPDKGFSGLTLRLWEPARRQWTLNWVNGSTGTLSPAMTGTFDAERRGTFFGQDELNGRPVFCRFVWSGIAATAARWEQAYSVDGEEWETNWTMQYTRTGP